MNRLRMMAAAVCAPFAPLVMKLAPVAENQPTSIASISEYQVSPHFWIAAQGFTENGQFQYKELLEVQENIQQYEADMPAMLQRFGPQLAMKIEPWMDRLHVSVSYYFPSRLGTFYQAPLRQISPAVGAANQAGALPAGWATDLTGWIKE